MPEVLNLRWEYVVGPLERMANIPVDFHGGMSIEGGGHLNGIGQDTEGMAFIGLAVDVGFAGGRRVSVQARLTDGREVWPGGCLTTGPSEGALRVEQFRFGVPLAKISVFRLGTRKVRNADWRFVRLPPRLGESGVHE